ncbi:MAG: type I restriction enzyme R subunit, partial [Sulfurimonas sp.]
MKFNEDSRVKIPTILHLMRLGYKYLSLKNPKIIWDSSTNIFTNIFYKSIKDINPELNDIEVNQVYDDVSLCLENEDLGKAFFEKLIDKSGTRLIDFENFNNNTFNVVTELTYKKDDDEFRPDIILLINGMPLVFIEVKKPNNQDGILAEHKRIQTRFQNKKFRKFVNLTQLMIFSNNMEYDDNSPMPIEGAFYATSSYQKPIFNYFREEQEFNLDNLLSTIGDTDETAVLKDNNLVSIKQSPEFAKNKKPDTPTQRLCT